MRKVDFSEKFFIREIIGEAVTKVGEANEKIVIVNADLMGTCRNRSFVEKFPKRSFNCGIAEQNMVSFSAGLAYEGFMPFAFSMAPFISMRACEQCRTDIAYADLPVRLIAPYAGVSGGISGATHWAIEDVAIMTSMPNMIVLEPSDPLQALKMINAMVESQSPIYLRNSVEPVPSIYDDSYEYEIGKASVANYGDDGTFICSGITVKYALEAAYRIEEETGKHIRVIDMHTIKPIDKEAVLSAVNTGTIIVAQDHNIIGGLGSMVSMVLAENNCICKFKNLGIPDKFFAMAHAPYLYHQLGYDAEGLYKQMMELIEG